MSKETMSTHKRFTILFLFICTSISAIEAQNLNGPASSTPDIRKFRVSGKVLNREDQTPLEYATVMLLQASDSVGVAGTVTDLNGAFKLEAKEGSFILKVQYIGYQAKFVSDINLTKQKPTLKLPDIFLQAEATTLDEVEISAERSRMEFSLDKKIFNVGKDLSNIGGTASDLLDNIPSVTVDVEGNVSLRGSNGVRILINGKPSGFTEFNSAEALQQLSANMIKKVEIVTNPSARYDAEGTAGIINIILKKDQRYGWNGNFDASGGYPPLQNTAVNINKRGEKLNLFANVGFRFRDLPRRAAEYRESTQSGALEIIEQEEEQSRKGFSGSFRGGADYSFNDKTTLTGSVLFRKGHDKTDETIEYLFRNANRELTSIENRDNFETEDEYSLDYNLNFERKFEQKGRKWTADVIYTSGGEIEASDALQQAFNPNYDPLGSPDLIQRVNNNEDQRNITLQSDYVHPFSDDKVFETGFRTTIRDIDTEYSVEEFNNELEVFEQLPNLTNDFSYDENIYAAYAIYGDKLKKFSYQFGIRSEYTEVQTLLRVTNERNNQSYVNVFPSAFFSYELKTGNAVQVSYSRRINRPRFWDLNPFFNFDNPLRFRSGNPNLTPEFTDAFEVSHIKYWDIGSLNSSIYYRNTTDVIVRINTLGEDGVNRSRPENVATRNDIGAEFSMNVSPIDLLDVTISANIYRGEIDGQNLGFRQTEFFSFTSRANTRISLQNDWDVQLMINYRGAENTPQGRREDLLFTDLGISKDILQNKATVTLRVTDIFNSMIYRYTVEGEDFFIEREGQWRGRRQVQMGFSYRLNQKKKANRGGGYG